MDQTSPNLKSDPLYLQAVECAHSLHRSKKSDVVNTPPGESATVHHASHATELISFENSNNLITEQQLLFLGLSLDYHHSRGLKTGRLRPNGPPEFATAVVDYDLELSLRTLELAEVLLREAKRDYYTQHLFKQVSLSLAQKFNRPQTQVFGLVRWREKIRRTSDSLRRFGLTRWQAFAYLAIGTALGALATLAVIKFWK